MEVSREHNPFLYSLALHAAVIALAIGVMSLPRPPAREILSVEWVDVTQEQIQALKTPESKANDRIVETQKVAPSKEAAPDAYLGEQTQTVARQSMSTRELSDRLNSKRKGQNAKAQAEHRAPKPQTAAQEKGAQTKPSLAALGNLGMEVLKAHAERPQDQNNARTVSRSPASVGDPGGAAPSEYVKGVSQGQETLLNTKEYVFYGYYKRIRESLDRAWNANLKENLTKLQYRGRTIASEMDHLTRLLVTLDQKGSVIAVQVLEESGTRDLDDAAIRAFNKAGPFPNPPQGLLDPSGRVSIRWEFILKT